MSSKLPSDWPDLFVMYVKDEGARCAHNQRGMFPSLSVDVERSVERVLREIDDHPNEVDNADDDWVDRWESGKLEDEIASAIEYYCSASLRALAEANPSLPPFDPVEVEQIRADMQAAIGAVADRYGLRVQYSELAPTEKVIPVGFKIYRRQPEQRDLFSNPSQRRLRIETSEGPKWIFSWGANTGRIHTTDDPRKAIEDVGDNLEYFQNKTSARVWSEQPPKRASNPPSKSKQRKKIWVVVTSANENRMSEIPRMTWTKAEAEANRLADAGQTAKIWEDATEREKTYFWEATYSPDVARAHRPANPRRNPSDHEIRRGSPRQDRLDRLVRRVSRG